MWVMTNPVLSLSKVVMDTNLNCIKGMYHRILIGKTVLMAGLKLLLTEFCIHDRLVTMCGLSILKSDWFLLIL